MSAGPPILRSVEEAAAWNAAIDARRAARSLAFHRLVASGLASTGAWSLATAIGLTHVLIPFVSGLLGAFVWSWVNRRPE